MGYSTTTNVLALSLGKGLSTLGTLAFAMVIARYLSHAQVGTYQQSMIAYNVVTHIFCLGISQGVYYFLPTEKIRTRGIVLDGLIALSVMGILGGLVLGLCGRVFFSDGGSNDELSLALAYMAILPIVMMPAGLVSSVLVTQNKVPLLTIYNVISNLCIVSAMMLACVIWSEPVSVVMSKVVVEAVFGLVAIALMYRVLPHDNWRPNLAKMKAMVAFSLPLGIASIFGMFQVTLDRMMVWALCSKAELAVYSFGAIEIPFIGIVTASIATVIQPDLRRKIGEGSKLEAIGLFSAAAEKSAVLLIPIMVFLFVCAEPFIVFLYTGAYIESAIPFRIYLLLLPVRIVMYGSMMVALGLNNVVLYRTAVAALVNLCVSFVLVSWIGSTGAAVATLLSTYLVVCLWSLWAIAGGIPCSITELLPYRKVAILMLVAILASIPSVGLRWSGAVSYPLIELMVSFVLYLIMLTSLAVLFKNDLLLSTWMQAKDYVLRRIGKQTYPV